MKNKKGNWIGTKLCSAKHNWELILVIFERNMLVWGRGEGEGEGTKNEMTAKNDTLII